MWRRYPQKRAPQFTGMFVGVKSVSLPSPDQSLVGRKAGPFFGVRQGLRRLEPSLGLLTALKAGMAKFFRCRCRCRGANGQGDDSGRNSSRAIGDPVFDFSQKKSNSILQKLFLVVESG